jgi:hypothetical protein
MKKGAMVEILNSIAWGNANAIEYFKSSVAKRGVPEQFWHQVRLAGEPLNRFHHVVQALAPRVAVLLHKGLNAASYFEGYRTEKISQQNGISIVLRWLGTFGLFRFDSLRMKPRGISRSNI